MIIFIIPAYDEEDNINSLLSSLSLKMIDLKRDYRVILVNDGSKDSTKEEALKFQDKILLEIIDHDTNRGVGQVFNSGFSRALELAKDNDIIVTKEADNTSDLNILNRMIQKIENGYDLVLASCYASEGKIIGTTWDRIILSYAANTIIRLFFKINGVRTYSSFYRAYRAGMLRRAFFAYEGRLIENNGFICMVEMLIKLSRLPVQIIEIPMVLRCDFRKGKSKMKKMKTIIEYISLFLKEVKPKKKDFQDILMRYKNYILWIK